jgi:N-methylhydantoinase A/oxoprolinase/acetone carboxylase beta subunit
MLSLGVDTGGTFTDVMVSEHGELHIFKLPSTPHDPTESFFRGIGQLCGGTAIESIIHGSTVATNALLERNGARVALVTTAGFEDILAIGRQNRPSLYDFDVEKTTPLVARDDIFGISERTLFDGTVEKKPDHKQIKRVADLVKTRGYDSIAVCFLHSYANPENEKIVAQVLEQTGVPVSVSHVVLPEYREYERFSTTSLNAYVSPRMASYVSAIEEKLPESVHFRIMQSNGGSISASRACKEAVRTILSGPAGGVVGAGEVARLAGFDKVITFDMGGTSTDVSLCDRGVSLRTQSTIGGCPIGIPVVDIHTVGAGGGSIAYLDAAGALHVGPRSAGAVPGPVCYGRGTELTVTDANLCLGRIYPRFFLGGRMHLNVARMQERMQEFANTLEMTLGEAAEGMLRVANAIMERAIRVISVERGHDPRQFSLIAFGGAGPMHACELARSLRIPTVIVPKNAGVLSTLGLLMADVVKDFSHTVLIAEDAISVSALDSLLSQLERHAVGVLRAEGFGADRCILERFLDVRYSGQSYEVTVPMTPNFIADFHSEHQRLYGYSNTSWPVDLVNIRLAARGVTESPALQRSAETGGHPENALLSREQVVFDGTARETSVYGREKLEAGMQFQGPAIVVEMSATTVIPPDYEARVDEYGNILLNLN